MPELPEVETIARDLRATVGRRIVRATVLWARTIVAPDPTSFARELQGLRILTVGRRGKWLTLSLDEGYTLLIHLRMSGQVRLEPEGAEIDRHARVALTLDDGRRMTLVDPRKFGRMVLTANPMDVLGDLGPEPLGEELTAGRLEDMLSRRRGRLKPLLLNQHFLAGLGNIYTDESLWRARLHPLRLANTLSREEAERLHGAIREVLREAITREGTTLDDGGYTGADGRPGRFAGQLAVYGRAGEPCPRCGTTIVRIVVGGRGTHFCPSCQQE